MQTNFRARLLFAISSEAVVDLSVGHAQPVVRKHFIAGIARNQSPAENLAPAAAQSRQRSRRKQLFASAREHRPDDDPSIQTMCLNMSSRSPSPIVLVSKRVSPNPGSLLNG